MAVATLSWPGIRVRSPISSIAFLSLGEELDADLPSTLNSRKLATGRVRPTADFRNQRVQAFQRLRIGFA